MNASVWEVVRAIRGPILLIVFGTLVALNHMDVIPFGRTWPILIIVYGLFLLLERVVRPAAPPWPPPGYPQQPQFPQGGVK